MQIITPQSTAAVSLTLQTYETLRHAVLTCQLAPDARLNVKELAEQLGASLGAVREALSRLTAEDLVIAEPHRGFRVTPISLDELLDLSSVRIDIETRCLQLSIEHGNVEWEAGVLAAFHRLSRWHSAGSDPHLDEDWNRLHSSFHEALLSSCPSLWTQRLRKMLFDKNARYRALSVAITSAHRDLEKEHRELMDTALSRDIEKSKRLLQEHIQKTTDAVVNQIGQHPYFRSVGSS